MESISSCRSSSLAPSSTARASEHLLDVKLLTHRRNVVLEKPQKLNEVWQMLAELVDIPSASECRLEAADLKTLAGVINEEHGSEKDFDEGLFLALRECLSRHQLIDSYNDSVDVAPAAGAVASIKSFGTGLVNAIMSPSKKKRDFETTMTPAKTSHDPNGPEDSENKSVKEPIVFDLPKQDIAEYKTSAVSEATSELEPILSEEDRTCKEPGLLGGCSEEREVSVMKRIKSLVVNFKSPLKRKRSAPKKSDAKELEKKLALEPIVFNLPGEDNNYPKYAIGIARQANGEKGSSVESGSTGSGLAAKSKLDHCSCLLEQEKQGSKWTVVRCFSVVELKYGTDNECVVATVKDNKAQTLQIGSASGAIAQALTYTMGWVLPSHASIGKQDNDLTELSWAAIIGKKKLEPRKPKMQPITEEREEENKTEENKTEENKAEKDETQHVGDSNSEFSIAIDKALASKYRWVAGKIYIPERCGDVFEYSATGCGELEVDESISVYLETLLFGLRAAKKLLDAIRRRVTIEPLPSSGRKLKFAGIDLLGMKLQGKTKVGTRLCSDPDDCGHWKLSQGEIFTGKVNFASLKMQLEASTKAGTTDYVEDDIDALVGVDAEEDDLWATFAPQNESHDFVVFKEDNAEVSVVVKVSALSVHKYLNHPDKAWQALQKIESNRKSDTLNPSKKGGLFSVLYAAENLSNSLITVMADLSKDYKVLTPEKDKMPFSAVWSSFQDLVLRVLVPLADIGVIHPDIRAGWNVTSNILFSHTKEPAMQIIDYDSLVLHNKWVPPDKDLKYICKEKAVTAFTFLWWQCVTVAYAWFMKKKQKQMEKVDLEEALKDTKNVFSSTLGTNFCALADRRDLGKRAFITYFNYMSTKLKQSKMSKGRM